MGDKPDPVPKDQYCPLTPWTDGMSPPFVDIALGFIEKQANWVPEVGEPPNGFWRAYNWTYDIDGSILLLACGQYLVHYEYPISITMNFGTSGGTCSISTPLGQCFYGQDDFASTMSGYNLLYDSGPYFKNGYWYCWPYPNPSDLPKSWDFADLFGVPKQPGYFAEEFWSEVHNRFCRYSSHKDGTNLKIWME